MTETKMLGDLEFVRIQLIPDKKLLREKPIRSSEDAANFVAEELALSDREVFALINMNAKGQPINACIVSIGDLCSSITHPREIFKFAFLSNAGSFISIHNHPSGDPTPSEADITTTRRLYEAGNLLGVPLLDHIIIGCGTKTRCSLRASGYMDYIDEPCYVQDKDIEYER